MDLLERVRATALLPEGEPVLVMLSGGRDSVCLLDIAARLGPARALHVNHGLRDDAGVDEAHCRSLCQRLEVPLVVVRAPAREAGGSGADPAPATGNVQAWAREVRYAAAASNAGADELVATAHTATDQAETVLYRLASSPSRRALLGMAPRDGRVVRPLLGVTRTETAAHCHARRLWWVDDPSNDTDTYARGRVRGKLMPALAAIHPGAERNIVRAAQLLREEAAVLDEMVDTALDGRDHVGLDHLRILPPALGRLVLRRLAEAAVGGLCPRAASRYEEVLELGDDAMLDLGDGARAVICDGVLSCERTPPLSARL